MPKAGYDLLKSKKYDPLIAQLVDRLGMEATATTWLNAEGWLDLMLRAAPQVSDAEWRHVERSIMPICAIYSAMGAALGKDVAFELLSDYLRETAKARGRRYAALFRLPGGRRLAMLTLGVLAQRYFGASAGFEPRLLEASSRRVRLEMHACPYLKWCEASDVPEIAPLFCDCDDCAYGSIDGLAFRREGTLARGNECCDFDFELS